LDVDKTNYFVVVKHKIIAKRFGLDCSATDLQNPRSRLYALHTDVLAKIHMLN